MFATFVDGPMTRKPATPNAALLPAPAGKRSPKISSALSALSARKSSLSKSNSAQIKTAC